MNSDEYNQGFSDGFSYYVKKDALKDNEEYVRGYLDGKDDREKRNKQKSGRLRIQRWGDGSASFWSP